MAADHRQKKDQVTDPDHTDPRAPMPEAPESTDPGSTPADADPTRMEQPPASRPDPESRAESGQMTRSERSPDAATDPTPAKDDPTRMEAPPASRPDPESREASSTAPTPAKDDPTRMEQPPESRAESREASSTAPTPAKDDPTRMEAPPASRPEPESRPPADPTRVRSAPEARGDGGTMRTAVVPKVRLEVLEGEQPGVSHELTAGTHVIGRSEEAAVCIFDVDASRRHAELTLSVDGLLLKDLGSGNGTLVNDEQQSEALLQPGDQLKIGSHVFVVHIEGGAGVPARVVAAVPSVAELRNSRKRRRPSDRLLVLMAVFGAIAVLITAFALTRRKHVDLGEEQRARHAKAEKIFNSGMEAFRAEQWSQAEEAFAEAASLHPRHPKAGKYLKATQREKETSLALAEAERLLAKGDLSGTEAALLRVHPDSVLSERAEEIQGRVDSVKLAGVLGDFREALERTDPMVIMETIEAPADTLPLPRARLELSALEGIDLGPMTTLLADARSRAPEAGEIRIAEDSLRVRTDGIAAAISDKTKEVRDLEQAADDSEEARVRRAIESTMAPVRTAFAKKNFPEAARLLKAGPVSENDYPQVRRVVRAARLALPRYQASIGRAERTEKAREHIASGNHYSQAYQAARKLSTSGTLTREALAGAVRMRYLSGRSAFNRERWAEAYSQWSKGKRLDKQDENIGSGLADLEKKAEEFYLQAYVNKNAVPDRARTGFKQVLKMCPPSSEWNGKAREQLASMGGY